MYNIRLENYVPEPRPVTGDFLVCAHYYAAWKKGAAQLHDGFNDLHDYPERTPLMGYYGEENPEVCDWEIKWAAEHGVNCFIHCWYRKKDNEGKPVTANDLRCGHGLHEALFNAKYQKYMKFAIMYEAQTRWGGTDASDLIEHLMPFWMENYFKRDNYLKIDGKPVLFVYDTKNQIRDAFETPEAQKAAFDACRDYAVRQSFKGMLFALCNGTLDLAAQADIFARGYDFRFTYGFPAVQDLDWFPPEEVIVQRQKDFYQRLLSCDPRRITLAVHCFRDDRPRMSGPWWRQGFHVEKGVKWYISPENFRRVVKNVREIAESLPEDAIGRRLIIVDNWNEWDEGHFVSPSHAYGFKYLQAIREELTHRDNLPDYRTPQDIGLGPYDQDWEKPDFTNVKRKDWYAETPLR